MNENEFSSRSRRTQPSRESMVKLSARRVSVRTVLGCVSTPFRFDASTREIGPRSTTGSSVGSNVTSRILDPRHFVPSIRMNCVPLLTSTPLRRAVAHIDTAISLTVFKPTLVVDFVWEEDTRKWDPRKLDQMRSLTSQLDLFDDNTWRQTFQVIPKLPFNFSHKFEDSTGRPSELQVLDWEAGALYWNCLRSTEGDEAKALAKVRQKYFDQFIRTDLHFYLGTTQQFHFIAPNPWVIIGVFPIPHEHQRTLF